jgi:hypothetical protein
MKPYSRIPRDPETIKVSRMIATTDSEHETMKLAAHELKLPIGQAMALLSQNYLDELSVE